jgi:hypothetical protein
MSLACGLEDLSKAAVLHCVEGLDRVEVFGEKRTCAGGLLCVGYLKSFRQGVDPEIAPWQSHCF